MLAVLDLNERRRNCDAVLRRNAEYFRSQVQGLGLSTGHSTTHIVPIVVGPDRALLYEACALMRKRGLFLPPVDYPTVAQDQVRYRCSITAGHTREDLDEALGILADTLVPMMRAKDLLAGRWPNVDFHVPGAELALPRHDPQVRELQPVRCGVGGAGVHGASSQPGRAFQGGQHGAVRAEPRRAGGRFPRQPPVPRGVAEEGIDARYSLGLSLGEYNHLVHIGALGFEEALRLLEARGDAYDASPEGAMASVAPVGLAEAETIAAVNGLDVALHNSPRQQVLSGARQDLDAALKQLDFIQPVFIEERSPCIHGCSRRCGTFSARARGHALAEAHEALPAERARQVRGGSGAGDFVDLLSRHVLRPVLWRESMETAAAAAPMPCSSKSAPERSCTTCSGGGGSITRATRPTAKRTSRPA